MMSALVGLVSRVPARVQTKLLAAFLAIAMLLIMVGAVGLQALSGVNQRAEELIKLQRKIEAYRQVQHDTTTQLYSVASALLLRGRADAVEHASPAQPVRVRRGSAAVRGQGRSRAAWYGSGKDYDRFIEIVTRVVELIRAGRPRRRETCKQHRLHLWPTVLSV